jgi:hypothetical protein
MRRPALFGLQHLNDAIAIQICRGVDPERVVGEAVEYVGREHGSPRMAAIFERTECRPGVPARVSNSSASQATLLQSWG